MTPRDHRGRHEGTWPCRRDRRPPSGRTVDTALLLILLFLAGAVLAGGCSSSQRAHGSSNESPATGCVTVSTAGTLQGTITAITTPATGQQTAAPVATKMTTVKPTSAKTATTVTTPVKAYTRPATGTVIAGQRILGGYGKLKIDNGNGSRDIVAVLTRWHSTTPLFGIYIRSGDTHTNEYVKDGMYDLYVLAGENWDPEGNRFDGDVAMLKLKDPLKYISSMDKRNVTVFPADEEDDAMETVAPADFPGL